ncbi:MAG: hypothetical protein WD873_03180, partial [Candidatus Hydrogenedentales bacterium]
ADMRSRNITYVEGDSVNLADSVSGELEVLEGLVMASRVVLGTADAIHLDYVLNYQSTNVTADEKTLTREQIEADLIRATIGMDLMFEDGEIKRIIVPLSNGSFLDVYVTVDTIAGGLINHPSIGTIWR